MITVRRATIQKPARDSNAYRYYLEVGEHAMMDRAVADKNPEAEEYLANEMLSRLVRKVQMAQRDGSVQLLRNKE